MNPQRRPEFERAVMPHLNAAYNLARWLTRDAHDAEDLVQESFLRAFRSFNSFDDVENARAWLLTIVRNTCYTFLKKKGVWPAAEFDEQFHTPHGTASDPEALLLHEAARAALNDCIESLPLAFREIVILREFEELPYNEISAIAKVPPGTVMSRLARGRKRLQDCLAGVLK